MLRRWIAVLILIFSLMSSGCVGTIIFATVLIKKRNAAEKARREGADCSESSPKIDYGRNVMDKAEGSE